MVLSDSDTLAVHLNDRSITGRLTRIWSSSHTTIGVVCGLMEGDGGNLGNFWNPQLTRRKLAASSRRLVTCSPDISAQWGRGRHHTPYSVLRKVQHPVWVLFLTRDGGNARVWSANTCVNSMTGNHYSCNGRLPPTLSQIWKYGVHLRICTWSLIS